MGIREAIVDYIKSENLESGIFTIHLDSKIIIRIHVITNGIGHLINRLKLFQSLFTSKNSMNIVIKI